MAGGIALAYSTSFSRIKHGGTRKGYSTLRHFIKKKRTDPKVRPRIRSKPGQAGTRAAAHGMIGGESRIMETAHIAARQAHIR